MIIRYLTFPQPREVALQELLCRKLHRDEVLVEAQYSLISNGTERLIFTGTYDVDSHWSKWVSYPFRPGYATVGTITDVGEDVPRSRIGERVAIRSPHASHQIVKPKWVIPIPDKVASEQAVWFALARISFLATWISAAALCSSVLIVGGGPLAQLVARWLAAQSKASIAMLSRFDAHLNYGRFGGVSVLIMGNAFDYSPDQIEKYIGRRPEILVDCTDLANMLEWSATVVADLGRIVLLGDPGVGLRCIPSDVLIRGISVVGTHDRLDYGGRWDNRGVAKLFFDSLVANRMTVDGLCTHFVRPENARLAYAGLLAHPSQCLGVRIDW
jgi:2-desacetyl-2-hydroxyethyl bacteriochlorophyllide A dehydrogenase